MILTDAAPNGRYLLIVDDDDRIRELLKEYLARRPAENPFVRFSAQLEADLPAMLEGSTEAFHAYAFHNPRMVGASMELLAGHVRWLFASDGQSEGEKAAAHLDDVVGGLLADDRVHQLVRHARRVDARRDVGELLVLAHAHHRDEVDLAGHGVDLRHARHLGDLGGDLRDAPGVGVDVDDGGDHGPLRSRAACPHHAALGAVRQCSRHGENAARGPYGGLTPVWPLGRKRVGPVRVVATAAGPKSPRRRRGC